MMKTTQATNSKLQSEADAIALINMIFDNQVVIDYDYSCIENIEVSFTDGKITSVFAVHYKLKVTPQSGQCIYWPIQPYKSKMDLDKGLEILKRSIP